jgi:hypothetical protein
MGSRMQQRVPVPSIVPYQSVQIHAKLGCGVNHLRSGVKKKENSSQMALIDEPPK